MILILASPFGLKFERSQKTFPLKLIHNRMLERIGELLILMLSISDLFSAIYYIIATKYFTINHVCTFGLSVLGTLFEPASVVIVCEISCMVLILLKKSEKTQTRSDLEKWVKRSYMACVFFAFAIPFFYTFFITKFKLYGKENWCRIFQKSEYAIYFYYFPVMIAMVFNMGMLLAINKVNKRYNRNKLSLIWWIPSFFFVWFFPILNEAWQYAKRHDPSFSPPLVFLVLGAICHPLEGFLNAILFSSILLSENKKETIEERVYFDENSDFKKTVCYLYGNKFEWFIEHDK
eukprot:TRINITY_DN6398_c0_g1_i1.p1 TRINITY_DN6398_c0_g1~~TRINITY_DN6398_c0_g1_i1.p1  ORF type:complete len:291 (+),score=29.51 TRINITY_DN6398_c0_g1_i1:209-1081(+)